jgi:hypothetical protein
LGAEAGTSAELSALRITFGQRGHGARHLTGTGLAAADVEAMLMREIQGIANRSRIAGEFRGRTTIVGIEIEYRAFLRDDGSIHVGTYYPVQ